MAWASYGAKCPICGGCIYVHKDKDVPCCDGCGRPKDPPVEDKGQYVLQPMD
jgi:hypothetical protein